MVPDPGDREFDVLVVGAGQAGLATAHHLRSRLPAGSRLCVVDVGELGGRWEQRWDSLHLFTPRRFSELAGLPFPAGPDPYPGRREVAGYLRAYAAHHHLSVRAGVRVTGLGRDGELFVATTHETGAATASTGTHHLRARQVVIATGPFAVPHRPDFSAELGPEVTQLHAGDYRRPADLPVGPVHVVGGGNSAAQLAIELADTGRAVHVVAPREPWYVPTHILGIDAYRWFRVAGVLNARTNAPLSRYIRRRGDVIVGTELRGRIQRGEITLTTSRAVHAAPGVLGLADGAKLGVEAVLWCTGFRQDTSWIQVPGALHPDGTPRHLHGASPVPGLHWMGLPWQTRLNSSLLSGVDRDAMRTAARIANALPRASR
ncbi:NAD(P)-binding domain-containing protein [Sporichthya sp.]|uniref:flavin-containing monooxygenase n=1 Tax=Sporichthya sp. TaxID=65475 RepID=UPI0017FEBFD0|nr:NAD(P)-binding domain-containing protein [Sporichthya sp.]MBA3743848.1 NAD(P)-binding domain-containing protein [Sporichthya sp.]